MENFEPLLFADRRRIVKAWDRTATQLTALKNLLSQADRILETSPSLPENRTGSLPGTARNGAGPHGRSTQALHHSRRAHGQQGRLHDREATRLRTLPPNGRTAQDARRGQTTQGFRFIGRSRLGLPLPSTLSPLPVSDLANRISPPSLSSTSLGARRKPHASWLRCGAALHTLPGPPPRPALNLNQNDLKQIAALRP